MTAEEFLLQIKKIDTVIDNKLIEITQWKDRATSTTTILTPDKVQSSGSQQKMADSVERWIDLEREINADIDELIKVKKQVLVVLEKVSNAEQYDVLHKLYVQHKDFPSVQAVADAVDRSVTWVQTRKKAGLKNLEKLLARLRKKNEETKAEIIASITAN